MVGSEKPICTRLYCSILIKRETFHFRNLITTGHRYGMQTMKSSLDPLREEEVITDSVYETLVRNYCWTGVVFPC